MKNKKIACKHKWFKHAIETSSETVLKNKTNKNLDFILEINTESIGIFALEKNNKTNKLGMQSGK